MFNKMMEMNILFLVISRFREIEVQIAKNHSEITFNIFRKLRATRIFRNIFISLVIILQVAGISMVFVGNNTVADNYINRKRYAPKTTWTIYGSYLVCISICLMLVGYLCSFIIQYRSLARLIKFLTPNSYL